MNTSQIMQDCQTVTRFIVDILKDKNPKDLALMYLGALMSPKVTSIHVIARDLLEDMNENTINEKYPDLFNALERMERV